MVTTVCENYSNNAITTLDGAIDNITTTLVVDDPTNFPSEGDFRIKLEDELMIVTNVTGSTFTVIRGVESTTAAAHADEVVVAHLFTAGSFLRGICQEIVHGGCSYGASSGGTDAYAITVASDPDVTQDPCELTEGMQVYFKADVTNTGAATLNLNGLGAVTIKKDASEDLESGDILEDMIVHVVYDGTNWQMVQGVVTSGDICEILQVLGKTGVGNSGCLYDPTAAVVVGGGGVATITADLDPAPTLDTGDFVDGSHCYFKLGGALAGAVACELTLNGTGPKTILQTNQAAIQAADGDTGDIWHCVYDRPNGRWFKIG